jgi:hypothetical protein
MPRSYSWSHRVSQILTALRTLDCAELQRAQIEALHDVEAENRSLREELRRRGEPDPASWTLKQEVFARNIRSLPAEIAITPGMVSVSFPAGDPACGARLRMNSLLPCLMTGRSPGSLDRHRTTPPRIPWIGCWRIWTSKCSGESPTTDAIRFAKIGHRHWPDWKRFFGRLRFGSPTRRAHRGGHGGRTGFT